jgi:hypothetical protein
MHHMFALRLMNMQALIHRYFDTPKGVNISSHCTQQKVCEEELLKQESELIMITKQLLTRSNIYSSATLHLLYVCNSTCDQNEGEQDLLPFYTNQNADALRLSED